MTRAWKISITVSMLAVLAALDGVASQDKEGSTPNLTGVIAFLYYEDFERASRFYGEALGLPRTYDRDGVEVFSVMVPQRETERRV